MKWDEAWGVPDPERKKDLDRRRAIAKRKLRAAGRDPFDAAARVSCSRCGVPAAVPCKGHPGSIHTARYEAAAQAEEGAP